MSVADWYSRKGLALFTDLYELTMIAGYWREGRANVPACFEYFFRSLPPHAGFAVAAGLGPFLDYLENLRFEEDDLSYLRSLKLFDGDFLDFLRDFRPTCSVRAVAEGTVVFPQMPLVQVEGPILAAQLVETALLNMLNFATLIATKTARICLAADGEPVLEFGLRRAHGPDGGLSGSRAAYIGGCVSTSNVLAGKVYGIPVAGTQAHSWVMSFPSELEAFRCFAHRYPERCVLLVDTYDTILSGVPNAITVFKELHGEGYRTRPAIRLDSGDLAKLSKIAHEMMRDAGFDDPLIVGSNDLDEDLIADLKRQGAKINAWGVGTHLITAYDCPALGGVYKLVALCENGQWQPRIKVSANMEKATEPGRKRVVRYYDKAGHPLGDVMYQDSESWAESGVIVGRRRSQPHLRRRLNNAARAEELLQTVFERGRRVTDPPPINEIQQRARDQIASLPEEFTRLRNPEIYRVILSQATGDLKEEMLEKPELM
ncbi:MAG TPA: nicotinate phosphoribosyltransferase [Candidatus Hydrogenedentes bacterium]|nr:nicotinate phosphoribosyltransferase [Candidatus Hydrogenedentota bacterium]HIJ72471.1 nicotinate phosphoribosyltransferase [Candidatus Hydrogenedentota bacterium]